VKISALKTVSVGPAKGMPTTNDMLGVEGIDGLKTGTLDGYASLLFSASVIIGADRPPLKVIGVALQDGGHQALHDDVEGLLESLKDGFHDVQVATQGQVVGTYTTPWGSSAKMVLGETKSVFTWSDTPIVSRMTAAKLGSGEDGEHVATVTYTAGKSSTTVPVVLEGTITPPSQWWRLTHPREVLGWGL
jgi:serine-type D-Ala-D-Ala carboxypeptidase (penicillin-binding protein 5/6)